MAIHRLSADKQQWASMPTPASLAVAQGPVSFTQEGVLFAVSGKRPSQVIHVTYDGGKTWDLRSSTSDVIWLYMLSAKSGFAVRNDFGGGRISDPKKPSIWKTGDGARTWSRIDTPVAFSRVFALSSSDLAATTSSGRNVYISRDSGMTWSEDIPALIPPSEVKR